VRRALILLAACSTRHPGPAPKSFTIYVNALKQPAGGVPVSVAFPDDWKVELDPLESPHFRPAEFDGPIGAPGVVAIFCHDAKTPDECADAAVKINFGDQPVTRRPAGGAGRVWVTATNEHSTHARLFQADVEDEVVVMCEGVFVDDDRRFVPAFTKACDTLKVKP
jgi:hypothetical protein